MGHGELRTSVILLKTVSNYCPKTFFFEFSYSSPIFGTPVELRTRIGNILGTIRTVKVQNAPI